MFQADFRKKLSPDYRGLVSKMGQKSPFFTYFPNATSDFDETWLKVGEYGLSSYDIGLYVGKTLGLEIIHLIPWRTIGLRKLKVF